MQWSWKIGTANGVAVRFHAMFLLLLAWLPLASLARGRSVATLGDGLALSIAVVLAVSLHELARAIAGRRLGILTREITVLPTGGIAKLERAPEPRHEVVAALAGPAANIALGGTLLGWLLATRGSPGALSTGPASTFAGDLLWANLVLGATNLLPGLPMDGGRILRALLAARGEAHATRFAASVGQGIALALAMAGIAGVPELGFLGLVVWLGATDEAAAQELAPAVSAIPVSRAMVRDFRVLAPDDSLDCAVEYVRAGFRQDFPVVDDGKLVGVLTLTSLLCSLVELGRQAPVSDAMERKFGSVEASEMLEGALTRLQGTSGGILPVVRNRRLVGVVTPESVGRFVMLGAARGEEDAAPVTRLGTRLRATGS
ncbi:CBS domain-containing protein [bacterium]|nr:CBS domain-containing protein [bacterium]